MNTCKSPERGFREIFSNVTINLTWKVFFNIKLLSYFWPCFPFLKRIISCLSPLTEQPWHETNEDTFLENWQEEYNALIRLCTDSKGFANHEYTINHLAVSLFINVKNIICRKESSDRLGSLPAPTFLPKIVAQKA